MTEKRIALVTGANGYIAGPTIVAFLAAGYAVRGTVRSKASAQFLVDALPQYKDSLEIVEVPDIVAPGAFDDAVKGTLCLVHRCRMAANRSLRRSCNCPSRISR